MAIRKPTRKLSIIIRSIFGKINIILSLWISHKHAEGMATNLAERYGLPVVIKKGVASMVSLDPVEYHYTKLRPTNLKEQPLTGDSLKNLLLDTSMFYPWT